jgi:hypothetical protein
MGLCLGLGYFLTLAVGALRVAGRTDYVPAAWLAVTAVGALSLVAAGWLGMGVGRLAPAAYTPPVLVLLGFLVLIPPVQVAKTDSPGTAALLVPNLSTNLDEFTTIPASVSLAQLAWFAGLAGSGLLLALLARRRTAVVAALPAVLGLVVAVPLLGAAPASGTQPDAGAMAEVCTHDSGPVVCVTKAHEPGLAALVGPARSALARLAVLPDPPRSVHEMPPFRVGPQPPDQVWLDSGNYVDGTGWITSDAAQLEVRVLAGAGTRPCESADYATRALIGAWLYGRYPAPGQILSPHPDTARWQALLALPHDEQVRRIAAARTAGLACHGDLAALLNGGGA